MGQSGAAEPLTAHARTLSLLSPSNGHGRGSSSLSQRLTATSHPGTDAGHIERRRPAVCPVACAVHRAAPIAVCGLWTGSTLCLPHGIHRESDARSARSLAKLGALRLSLSACLISLSERQRAIVGAWCFSPCPPVVSHSSAPHSLPSELYAACIHAGSCIWGGAALRTTRSPRANGLPRLHSPAAAAAALCVTRGIEAPDIRIRLHLRAAFCRAVAAAQVRCPPDAVAHIE